MDILINSLEIYLPSCHLQELQIIFLLNKYFRLRYVGVYKECSFSNTGDGAAILAVSSFALWRLARLVERRSYKACLPKVRVPDLQLLASGTDT